MITKDNIKLVLADLAFAMDASGIWSKSFDDCTTLGVDVDNGRFFYPAALKVHVNTTTNFTAQESFVVFECVHRLLQQGYKAGHIELECPVKVGHGASGGRLDIWVKDNDERSLLVIECKTPGREFDNAWNDMLEDGGQLFTYANALDSKTRFVALYTSSWNGAQVVPDYRLVSLRDNDEFLDTLPKGAPSFKKAATLKERFRAWLETYRQDFSTRGLFENDIAAYAIGKTKYSINDLKSVDNTAIQRKYHEFATILRQHNVASHENAFDKLVNLFLAKIVDESENADELKFYWKGAAYDDVFSLTDRLQFLYMRGMKEFLGEEVTYIEQRQIEEAFRLFKKDATKKVILDYFRQLKFFTENHFAFINVHNEKLFHQNAAVLLAIVRMLQDIRLQTQEHNQFLGDLFEGFLDKGVKQSEGQFFTPMPIVRFLISALPLERLVADSDKPPQCIDYACGAGHFLTEYCHQIFPFVRRKAPRNKSGVELVTRDLFAPWYAAVTGIEKEYRLSKVSKVSACMYGHNEIKIIYSDALATHPEVRDGAYQVLVANPPYSVKGFLETLPEAERARYDLFDPSGDLVRNNAIETFFVERAKQLLAPGGVAAIILPSSILSNGGIYTRMREILLKYFDIVAIAEFGSGTFGKTGTNTATLFLRRKATAPDLADHYRNRVDAWFSGEFSHDSTFGDAHLLAAYCERQNIPLATYQSLLNGKPVKDLLANEMFMEYRKDFDKSTIAKNIAKKRLTAKYTVAQSAAELERAWLQYLREIEGDKLYYFMLAASSSTPVVLVKSPADKEGIKNFLGYEWSSRKGNEGIKYLHRTAGAPTPPPSEEESDPDAPQPPGFTGLASIQTPLFNPQGLDDAGKINTIIRAAFQKETPEIPENIVPYVSRAALTDLLDFSRTTFDKAFKTSVAEATAQVKSKWPLVAVGKTCQFQYGKPLKESDRKPGVFPVYGSNGIVGYHNEYLVKAPFIVVGRKGSAGKLLYSNEDGYPIDTTFYIDQTKDGALLEYLYLALGTLDLEKVNNQMGVPGLNRNDAYQLLIPLPPLDIQNKIVAECEAVDEETNTNRTLIEDHQAKIGKIFNDLEAMASARSERQLLYQLLTKVQGKQTKIPESEVLQEGKHPVITQERDRLVSGYTNKDDCITDLPIIVFGDHSCSFKYVDFPFVRGADGTQLLKTDEKIIRMKFLCEYLKTVSIENAERYERHFKYLKNTNIPIPSLDEQDRIIAEVEQLEATITTARQTIAAAPAQKAAILKKWLEE